MIPLITKSEDENGILKWSHQTLEATNYEKVVKMLMDDMEVKDIAEDWEFQKLRFMHIERMLRKVEI